MEHRDQLRAGHLPRTPRHELSDLQLHSGRPAGVVCSRG
jgi:hypothetical protein